MGWLWIGKVLHVFGLQPTVRKDINEWLEDLFKTFAYLSNKTNEEYKEIKLRVLDIYFNKTDHNSYFTKLNFGTLKMKKSRMNDIKHIISDWNIVIQNDRTTVYTTNTLNIQTDLEFNVHT